MKYSYGFQLHTLARMWKLALDYALQPEQLTQATGTALVHIDDIGEGLCQRDLAERLGIEQPTLVRTLNLLVAQGLIERRSCDQDQRIKRLYLTDEGRALIARIHLRRTQCQDAILEGIPADELDVVRHALEQMQRNLNTLLDRRKGRDSGAEEDKA